MYKYMEVQPTPHKKKILRCIKQHPYQKSTSCKNKARGIYIPEVMIWE